MATLLHLAKHGQVARIDPELDKEERFIYALPRFREWLEGTLPTLASSWNLEETPLEQFDVLLERFCSGDFLTVGQHFKCLYDHAQGIWELKTADLRIFGWFYRRDEFIATAGEATWRVKEFDLYRGLRDQSVRERNSFDLDEPKFIPGSEPNAVVSSFNFP